MNDGLVQLVSETIDGFFAEVDPEDFETEDLAVSIVRVIVQRRPSVAGLHFEKGQD
jgi:hypothetical protein